MRVCSRVFFGISTAMIVLLFGTTSMGEWQTMETPRFRLIHHSQDSDKARDILNSLEYYQFKHSLFTPSFATSLPKRTILLQDNGQSSNASALIASGKIMILSQSLILHEPHASFYHSNSYWLDTAAIHELAHQQHLSLTSGLPHNTQALFGQRLSTQQFLPPSLIEGIAVYEESLISPYAGRLNVGYFDALLLTKAKANTLADTLQDASLSTTTFPKGHWYVYGAGFIQYLKNRFGPQKLALFLERYGQSSQALLTNAILPEAGLDSVAKAVFQQSLTDLYSDWKKDLKRRASSWILPSDPITATPYTIYSPLTTYKDTLFYAETRSYFNQHFSNHTTHSLYQFSPEMEAPSLILKETSPFTGELHATGRHLYFMSKDSAQGHNNYLNNTLGVTHKLYRYDLETREKRVLIREPITAYEPLDHQRILYTTPSTNGYGSELWLWSQKTGSQKQQTLPLEIGEFLQTPHGILVIAKAKRGTWDIFYLDDTLKESPTLIFSTPYIEKNMRLLSSTPANLKILLTSSLNKAFKPYLLTLDMASFKRSEQLKQSAYASLYPAPTSVSPDTMTSSVILKNKLYYTSLHADGQGIYQTAINAPAITAPSKKIKLPTTTGFRYAPPLEAVTAEATPELMPWPHTRLIPFLVKGETDDKRDDYQLEHSSSTPFKGTLLSRRLSPITLSGQFTYYSNKTKLLKWAVARDVFNRDGNGLNTISLYYENSLRQTDQSRTWHYFQETLGTYATYGIPNQTGIIQYEQELASQASFTYFSHTITHRNTSLNTSLRKPNGLWTSVTPKGRPLFEFKNGTYTSIELSRPLLTINKGIWSPNIYAETLIGSLFYESANISKTIEGSQLNFYATPFYYYGAELSLSIKAFYNVYIIPRIGISYSSTANTSEYFTFSISNYF